MGKPNNHTTTWIWLHSWRTTCFTSWNSPYENIISLICLVARFGWGYWIICQELLEVSSSSSWVHQLLQVYLGGGQLAPGLDYTWLCRPLYGQYVFIIDAYSKWLEVKVMKSTVSTAIISSLRSIFAQFGLPFVIVTDNARTSLVQNLNIFYASMVSDTCFHPHTIQHKYHMCYFIATSLHTVQQVSLPQSCFKIAD